MQSTVPNTVSDLSGFHNGEKSVCGDVLLDNPRNSEQLRGSLRLLALTILRLRRWRAWFSCITSSEFGASGCFQCHGPIELLDVVRSDTAPTSVHTRQLAVECGSRSRQHVGHHVRRDRSRVCGENQRSE